MTPNPIRFYGYKHWTLEHLPRCFNVGKGQGRRHSSRSGRNHKWRAIVKKYGLRVEICIGPVTNEEACQWEIAEIEKEKTFTLNHSHDDPNDIGCNLTIGGEGSTGHTCKHTDATRQKMSLSHKGKRVGELHPMYGKHHTDESRKKMGRSGELNKMYGKKHTEESLQKMTKAHSGKKQSDLTKQRKSILNSGEGNPHAKLTWEKVREIRSKYVPRVYSKAKLALEYSVSWSAIDRILGGISWKEHTIAESDVDPKIMAAYEAYRMNQ